MSDDKRTTALAGPWKAFLSDRDGDVYTSAAQAAEELGENTEMEISVRRDSALPSEDSPNSLPGSWHSGDLAYVEEAYLEELDESISAETRHIQAQAMADGLNAAWRAAR